jgi:acid phosphatase
MRFSRVLIPIVFIFAAHLAAESVRAQERLCDTAFEDCRGPLWSLIDQETAGIDVAFWFMQDTSIANKLISRHQAGIPIRILVDPRANPTYAGNEQILNQLAAAGIPMRYSVSGGILHWKMMLFVGQNTVQFSGANFSPSFFVPTQSNVNYIDEAIYFTDDDALVRSFKTKYDDLWTNVIRYANYANINGPLTRRYPTFPINADLNFPPSVDDSQDFFNRTQRHFNLETQKIDIVMYRITNQRYTDTTIEAVNRGIPVRLLHEPNEYRNPARQWDSWNVDRLYMAGVQIKMRRHLGLNHQKSVILYGQGLTIFGSSNWTGPSSNSQEEHNYFTTKLWFFQWFVDQFERKWNSPTENEPFVPLPPNEPAYLSPVNGNIAQPTTAVLRWEGGPWAHKYDIYFGTSPNPPLLIADASTSQSGAVAGQPRLDTGSVDDGVVESFTIPTTLLPGTTYYWRIVGKTMANQAVSGPTWSFVTTGTEPAPAAPSGLSAVAVSTNRVELSWNDVAGETGYRVERSPNGSTSWSEIASPSANQVSFADVQVSPQQTFYYRIRAFNTSGFSPYSNVASATTPQLPPPSVNDIVLWAGEAPVKVGNWTTVADSTAAGGVRIASQDLGAPKRTTALANPTDYFEMTFNAQAGTDYRIWVRGKAQSDFWGNDSVFIQFSDSVNSSGNPVFRIGTTSATEMNLEECSGCGIQGWGWQDNGWGIGVLGPLLRFQSSGSHTLRIQTREDGLSIDQIVLSPQTFLNAAPGSPRNDNTMLPKSTGGGPNPAPIVDTITPPSGSTLGGTSITISGSGFLSGATVSLGGTPATNVTVVNVNTITGITAARASGTVDLAVTNPDGQSDVLPNGYTYVAPPTIANITPNSGPTFGGTTISISGTGFQPGATVTIGGTNASNVSVVNSTSLTALTSAHTAGTVDVVVTNPDGQAATLAQGFSYVAPQVSIPQFDHVFVVVLENQSFENVIGSAAMPYLNTLANRYGLSVNYFANTQPSIGNYFWLTTGQVITNNSNFSGTVTADNIVRQFMTDGKTWKAYAENLPAVGYTGGDQYPYVKRHNPFAYLSDVLTNPTQANNIVPFTHFAADVTNNQLPRYSFIIPNQYNNSHDCPPQIPSCTNADKLATSDNWLKTNIDPLLASPAFRNNGLLIITYDESVNSDLQHGGGHIATLVISSKAKQSYQSTSFYQHQSTLRLTSEALGLTGYPGASVNAANMSEFFTTVPNTAPILTGVAPSVGPVTGGTPVTISGTGFAQGATVSFGGTPATSVTVVGSTSLTAITPAHSSGAVDVVVTNPGGQSGTRQNGFTYQAGPPPVVSGVQPNSGPTDGGTIVTISGSGFLTGANVMVGSVPAVNVTVNSNSNIVATTAAHAAGTVAVVVTNPDGQSSSLANSFTYVAPPGAETVLLTDNFDDGSLNTTNWFANNLFSGFTDPTVSIVETQVLEIGPLKQNIDGSHYNGIRSRNAYNFSGGYAYVQLVQAPNSNTAADAFYTIGLNVDNCYRIYVEAGNLFLQSKIGGAKQALLSLPFNPINHAFWRIRHDIISGNVIFETAPANGAVPGTWTQLYSAPWNTVAVPLGSVVFELKAGTWRAETNSPGTVRFDNFKAARP